MDKLKMSTPDLTDKNIEQIGALFPNVITEVEDLTTEGTEGHGKKKFKKVVDFDLLRQMLSKDLVEGSDERYRLDWPGKKASLLKANTPITKTLRPCREESVNFDTTENLYIEGDNFDVLKILQESYLGKIKMICIDPPYNTGNDFIYKDNFTKSKDEYEEELGATDEEGGKLFRNTDSNGRFHSDWLSMMYERLVVARDLLKEDGVIFINIDDNEVHNLRKICDEIYGENSFVGNFIWEKRTNRENRKEVSYRHDNVLCYVKNRIAAKAIHQLPMNAKALSNYKNPDNDSRGPWKSDPATAQAGHGTKSQFYELTAPNGKAHNLESGRCWLYTSDVMQDAINDNRIWFGKDGNGVPRIKTYLYDKDRGLTPETILFAKYASTNEAAKNALKQLFGGKAVFETPKPTELIGLLIQMCSTDGLILDFFAGSCATAHAVMQLNAEDGGNRKFIMVQLPEPCDENSEAFKAGYKTIAEIGKERIRRAAKMINDELLMVNKKMVNGELSIMNEEENSLFQDDSNSQFTTHNLPLSLDFGFRVYKTDSTNMKDVFYHPSELTQHLLPGLESNIKEDRTPEDLLTQVILDLGLELTLPIETKQILGNTVFIVQTNALVACFDKDIDFKTCAERSRSIVDTISDLKPLKVVFKDASFKDDKDRINVEERFKRLSPETKVTVI